MIRLIAYDTAGTQHNLDLYGDESVNFTFQVDEVRDIDNKNGSYSKTFDIPATKTNNVYFNHIYRVEVDSTYNPSLSADVEIYDDGVLLFEGGMYLNEVITKGDERMYNVEVFSRSITFMEKLGEATINDLDFSDLAHSYTTSNIVDSWDSTGVTLTAGGTSTDVFYPLIDAGTLIEGYSQVVVDKKTCFAPYISLKYMVDKIFAYAGVSYNSTFLDGADFAKYYMDTNAGKQVELYIDMFADVQLTSNQALTTSLAVLDLDVENADANGIYNNLQQKYVATTADESVNIKATIPFVGDDSSIVYVYAEVVTGGTTTTTLLDTVQTQSAWTHSGSTTVASINYTVQLAAIGDTIQLKVKKSSGSGTISATNTASIYWYDTIGTPYVLGSLNLSCVYTTQQTGIENKIKNGRGEVLLKDLMRDVIKLFNLVFEPTQNGSIDIEPEKDFMSGGTRLDWTDKVDKSTMKQIFIEVPSHIAFRYNNDDNDALLSQYKAVTGREYGEQIIGTGADRLSEKEIKLDVFSATAFKGYGANYLSAIYKDLEDNGTWTQSTYFDCKPRLLIKTGDVQNIVYQTSFAGGGMSGTQAATPTHYDKDLYLVTNSDKSLNFGNHANLFSSINVTTPIHNLYVRYYLDYIVNRYSAKAQLVKVNARLDRKDISELSFANTILVEGVEYYLNKVDYNTDGTAKVELLKRIR